MSNELNIYWIRHSFSEANAMRIIGESWENVFKYIPNCALNDIGVKQAQQLSSYIKNKDIKLPKFDHIFSSEFLRAAQTASILFDNRNIHILPYISEKVSYDVNYLYYKLGYMIDQLGRKLGRSPKIKLDFYKHLNDYNCNNILDCWTKSENNKFISTILPRLLKYNNIAIVSHQMYIKDQLQINNSAYMIPNTGIWKQTYTYDEKSIIVTDVKPIYPLNNCDIIGLNYYNYFIDMNINNHHNDNNKKKIMKYAIYKSFSASNK